MKKMLRVLMLAMLIVIILGSLVQARPPGSWVEFATIHGQNVGEPDYIKVYYDKDSLQVNPNHVFVKLWYEGELGFHWVRLENLPYRGWVYLDESNRVYWRGPAGISSNIEPAPIPKGSILHQLLKTLYSPDGQLRKEINEILEKKRERQNLESKSMEYHRIIEKRIKEKWVIREYLIEGRNKLETVIILLIGKEGKIQKMWFEKESGNSNYDQMAIRAIKKAEPFPPIPEELKENTLEIGIRFIPD